uniref:T9SS type A sorting domain-containing protein n=1 Tax=Alloprevotella sp. TaxID=1872471 RepID=UPI0040257DBC
MKNLPQASKVQLFDAQGKLQATVLAEGETSFELTIPGVYVVNVNGRSFKVKK